jgi:hypothetical protein
MGTDEVGVVVRRDIEVVSGLWGAVLQVHVQRQTRAHSEHECGPIGQHGRRSDTQRERKQAFWTTSRALCTLRFEWLSCDQSIYQVCAHWQDDQHADVAPRGSATCLRGANRPSAKLHVCKDEREVCKALVGVYLGCEGGSSRHGSLGSAYLGCGHG